MSSITETAIADTITSTRSSCRQWFFSSASTSSPLALASISARSRNVTISWSRSAGDSSRSPNSASRNTASPTQPQILYSCVQNRSLSTTAGIVMLPTTATIRLPITGPDVQKPIAAARPTCGEKSRISAGVATRQMPSTMPTANVSTVNTYLSVAYGTMNSVNTPENSKPNTTRLALPYRSVIPANSEPNAPSRLPSASVTT